MWDSQAYKNPWRKLEPNPGEPRYVLSVHGVGYNLPHFIDRGLARL
jgi:hypothetical protein